MYYECNKADLLRKILTSMFVNIELIIKSIYEFRDL
jgi:hypothetical protein